MFNRAFRTVAALSLAAVTVFAITGCAAGDENPVTPEKMEEIRNKTNAERANFNPDMSQKPPAGG